MPGRAGIGGLDLSATKQITGMFTGDEEGAGYELSKYNIYRLNVDGAVEKRFPTLRDGRIIETKGLSREGKSLPLVGHTKVLLALLIRHSDVWDLLAALRQQYGKLPNATPQNVSVNVQQAMMTLEVLLLDGWVTGELDPTRKTLNVRPSKEHAMIHRNEDVDGAAVSTGA